MGTSKIIVTFGNMILPRVGYHVPKVIATFCEILNKKNQVPQEYDDECHVFTESTHTPFRNRDPSNARVFCL